MNISESRIERERIPHQAELLHFIFDETVKDICFII